MTPLCYAALVGDPLLIYSLLQEKARLGFRGMGLRRLRGASKSLSARGERVNLRIFLVLYSLGLGALRSRCPSKTRVVASLLGGSWVVISRVISRVAILITPLITTHETPSSG